MFVIDVKRLRNRCLPRWCSIFAGDSFREVFGNVKFGNVKKAGRFIFKLLETKRRVEFLNPEY
ncbi:MAG: hypothetical protein C4548_07685 [Desulfobacteraceae bacterium]|nr:MAG: hypothetical protein C4548_07685 [Desulfobacteraceae bacterium]